MLEIRFLGEFQIRRNGERLDLPKSKMTLALLAYLALTGRRQRREHLCDMFWELTSDPRGALRWSLSKLRGLVDEPDRQHINADRAAVSFEPLGATIDFLDLRAQCADGFNGAQRDRLKELATQLEPGLLETITLPRCPSFEAWRTAFRDEQDDLRRRIDHALSGEPDTGLSAPPDLPEKPSIAVLPFVGMAQASEPDFLADGITEDLIADLSKYRRFFVISRNTVFTYKGENVDSKRVARNLGIQYVLSGSVRRAGNRVRITAQFVDAVADKQVWADRFDRTLDDVFAVQDEITDRIVATIGSEFMAAEIRRTRQVDPDRLEIRDYVMRALWHFARYTPRDNGEAQRLMYEALEENPRAATCHATLALTMHMDFMYGWREKQVQSIHEAHQAALRAVALDDQDGQALRVLGIMDLYMRRHDEARQDFERALEVNPNDADALANLGAVAGFCGDYETACRHFEMAKRQSPRDPFIVGWYNFLAIGAVVAGHDREAADLARKAIRIKSSFPGGYRSLATACSHLGLEQEAREALNELLRLVPDLSVSFVRERLPIQDPNCMKRYLDGLRMAGLRE